MAHTIQGNAFTTFYVNGDFSGDVEIVRHAGTSIEERMRLPIEAMEAFLAEMLRRKRIEQVEQMSDKKVLAAAARL